MSERRYIPKLHRRILRRRVDDEVASELSFHVEMRTRELVEAGMDEVEARAEAIRRFGGYAGVAYECRRIARGRNQMMNIRQWWAEIRQDLFFALRTANRTRTLTALMVLTLGLGIGANTAVFSIVNTVILQPLPFPDADRLINVFERTPSGTPFSGSEPNFLDFRESTQSFEALAAMPFPQPQLTLLGDGEPRRLAGIAATSEIFQIIGARTVIGRIFSSDEEVAGDPRRVVVLEEDFWRRRFGEDPGIVGRDLNLDGEAWRVIGVVSSNFSMVREGDVWIPFAPSADADRGDHRLSVIGKLGAGVSLEAANDELSAIAAGLGDKYPDTNGGWGVALVSFSDWLVGSEARQTTLLLQCAVGLMLLLACANVSNLLIARATTREREIGLRCALGAGRLRIVRQLLTESVFLSLLGGATGAVIAYICIPVIATLNPEALPRLEDVSLDTGVLLFTLAVSIGVGLLAGLAPALQISRNDVSDVLRDRQSSGTFGARKLRDVLVVAELALAMVILIGAGLIGASFQRLYQVDAGFETTSVTAVQIELPTTKYQEGGDETRKLYRDVLQLVREIPGIDSAGAGIVDPFRDLRPSIAVGNETAETMDEFIRIQWRAVTEGYFETLGIPLLRGRRFDNRDQIRSAEGRDEPEVLISASLAQKLYGDDDPIGRVVQWAQPGDFKIRVAGVVGDVRDVFLSALPEPTLYLNHELVGFPSMNIFVRSQASAGALAAPIRDSLWAVDQDLPAPQIWPLGENLTDAVSGPRLNAVLMSTFALVALVMACMGIYGIMSYTVARRRREIGVRLAIGGRPRDMVGLVLKRGLVLISLGTVIGVAGALGLSRYFESLLYQTSPTDTGTFVGLASVLTLIGVLACAIPAVRASQIDPSTPLREE